MVGVYVNETASNTQNPEDTLQICGKDVVDLMLLAVCEGHALRAVIQSASSASSLFQLIFSIIQPTNELIHVF